MSEGLGPKDGIGIQPLLRCLRTLSEFLISRQVSGPGLLQQPDSISHSSLPHPFTWIVSVKYKKEMKEFITSHWSIKIKGCFELSKSGEVTLSAWKGLFCLTLLSTTVLMLFKSVALWPGWLSRLPILFVKKNWAKRLLAALFHFSSSEQVMHVLWMGTPQSNTYWQM